MRRKNNICQVCQFVIMDLLIFVTLPSLVIFIALQPRPASSLGCYNCVTRNKSVDNRLNRYLLDRGSVLIVMLVWLQECAELRGFSLQQEVCRGRGSQASGVQSGQGLGPGQLFSTDMLAMYDTYK